MNRIVLAAIAGLVAGPALGDATAMCMDGKDGREEVCTCATDALAETASEDDRRLYDEIGTLYLANMEDGTDRGTAWTSAMQKVAADEGVGTTSLMVRMNAVGKAHRAAMKACRE